MMKALIVLVCLVAVACALECYVGVQSPPKPGSTVGLTETNCTHIQTRCSRFYYDEDLYYGCDGAPNCPIAINYGDDPDHEHFTCCEGDLCNLASTASTVQSFATLILSLAVIAICVFY